VTSPKASEIEAARELVRLARDPAERCAALSLFVETALARHEWQAYDEAERLAQELVETTDAASEAHARAQLLLGEVRLAVLFRSTDAMTPLEAAAERFEALFGAHAPETGRAHERLAFAASKRADWDRAARALERAIAALRESSDDETLRALHLRLATALERSGRPADALRVLDERRERVDTLGPSMRVVLGRALVTAGRLDEAREVARSLARERSSREAFEIEARVRSASGDRARALAFHDAYAIHSGEGDLGLFEPIVGGEASAASRLRIDAVQYAFDATRFDFDAVARARVALDLAFPAGAELLPILERVFSGMNVYTGRNDESHGSGWCERVWLVEGFSREPVAASDDEAPRPPWLLYRALVAERGALRESTTAEIHARFVRLAAWRQASEIERAAILDALHAIGGARMREQQGRYPSAVAREPSIEVLAASRSGDRLEVTYLVHFRLSCFAQSGSDWDDHHVIVACAAFEGRALVAERTISEQVKTIIDRDTDAYDDDATVARVRQDTVERLPP
jgi:hypothetical protein